MSDTMRSESTVQYAVRRKSKAALHSPALLLVSQYQVAFEQDTGQWTRLTA